MSRGQNIGFARQCVTLTVNARPFLSMRVNARPSPSLPVTDWIVAICQNPQNALKTPKLLLTVA